TAQIAAEILESDKLRLSQNLASGGNSWDLLNELDRDHRGLDNILLVGHEPDLSRLVSVLTTGGETLSLTFKKAGLCKLKMEQLRTNRCASLEWFLTPAQLELLASAK
ncbi:MAG: hypothetical protein ABIV39_12260, partial [Verrucomicrobiota bacterium]